MNKNQYNGRNGNGYQPNDLDLKRPPGSEDGSKPIGPKNIMINDRNYDEMSWFMFLVGFSVSSLFWGIILTIIVFTCNL